MWDPVWFSGLTWLFAGIGLLGPLAMTWAYPPEVERWVVERETGWDPANILRGIRLLLTAGIGIAAGVIGCTPVEMTPIVAMGMIITQHFLVSCFTDFWFHRVDRKMGWVHVLALTMLAGLVMPSWVMWVLLGLTLLLTVLFAGNMLFTSVTFGSSDIRAIAMVIIWFMVAPAPLLTAIWFTGLFVTVTVCWFIWGWVTATRAQEGAMRSLRYGFVQALRAKRPGVPTTLGPLVASVLISGAL